MGTHKLIDCLPVASDKYKVQSTRYRGIHVSMYVPSIGLCTLQVVPEANRLTTNATVESLTIHIPWSAVEIRYSQKLLI